MLTNYSCTQLATSPDVEEVIFRVPCKAQRLKLSTGMLCIQFVFICLQIVSKKGDR
ncbi:hypothetical protein QUB63_02270 [Microcoleus sp. ARI1-B5]|uniref:hypothetical protein n=1 Tax=unclassified Microcoleus TaxID=2642155 RepID=UPI002FD3372D